MAEKRRLRIRRIDRVALVDKGDNPDAEVLIHKRAPDVDEVSGIRALLTAIGKRLGWAAAEVEQVVHEVETGDTEILEVTPMPEPIKDTQAVEDVEKAQAELAKRVEDMEKRAVEAETRVQKLEVEKRQAVYIEKVRTMSHLPIEADTFGPVLCKIADALSADEMVEVERVLAAANEAHRTGALFAEVGKGGDPGDAVTKVAALVATTKQADPTLTAEQAAARVYKQNPDLRVEVEREERDQRAKSR